MSLRESISGIFTSDRGISVNIIPKDTSPESQELLLQPEAEFILDYQITEEDAYCGVLEFRTPAPIEVQNRARPDDLEWKSDQGEISATEIKHGDLILMKVVLPSQYRGKKRGKIEIIERSGGVETKLCEHPVVSDPPLTHTSS